MPQFDSTSFFNQVILLFLFFFSFYFFLVYFFLPKISFTIKFRKKKINANQKIFEFLFFENLYKHLNLSLVNLNIYSLLFSILTIIKKNNKTINNEMVKGLIKKNTINNNIKTLIVKRYSSNFSMDI